MGRSGRRTWDCYKRQKERKKNEEGEETGVSMARHPVQLRRRSIPRSRWLPGRPNAEGEMECVSVNQASCGSHKWHQKHDKKTSVGKKRGPCLLKKKVLKKGFNNKIESTVLQKPHVYERRKRGDVFGV